MITPVQYQEVLARKQDLASAVTMSEIPAPSTMRTQVSLQKPSRMMTQSQYKRLTSRHLARVAGFNLLLELVFQYPLPVSMMPHGQCVSSNAFSNYVDTVQPEVVWGDGKNSDHHANMLRQVSVSSKSSLCGVPAKKGVAFIAMAAKNVDLNWSFWSS